MALRTTHPPATPVADTHLSPVFAAHAVGKPGPGDGNDVLLTETGLKNIDVTVPLGQTWANGDHVYRLKRTAVWAKWDTVTNLGTTVDVSGVVRTVIGGVAQVTLEGTLVAANITNLASAKANGLHIAALVAA